jgi:DNA-binding MarR family transcriptional regulator
MTSLKSEIAQQRPFASKEEEALLNILRTADCLQREFQRRSREWGVTATQYNVLRILRGAHPEGLTCTSLGDRMITAEPDITRLLKRLSGMGFIRQKRDTADRRVVRTFISAKGLQLLEQMDPVIDRTPRQMLGHMKQNQIEQLIALTEEARKGCGDAATPGCDGSRSGVSCDGKKEE